MMKDSYTYNPASNAASDDGLLTHSILRTLLYFDLFRYPLKSDEVYTHLQSNHVTFDDVTRELNNMTERGILYQADGFFSIQHDRTLVDRRLKGNLFAESLRSIALRRGRLIFQFPFVRAVMISGSLSKNYADQDTDIDFFVVTSPGRLWIARTMLVLFKRAFLLNSHKYFCVNYFIDEDHLEIEEKNLFTATELSTLIPLFGDGYHARLMEANKWLTNMLPHAFEKGRQLTTPSSHHWLKKTIEWLLNSRLGDSLEQGFMNMTRRRWQRLYGARVRQADFAVAFKSERHVSKNHPENFQQKVMSRYKEKLDQFTFPPQNANG